MTAGQLVTAICGNPAVATVILVVAVGAAIWLVQHRPRY